MATVKYNLGNVGGVTEVYSTDEQLTGGTWIDGKSIYRKVLLCTKDTELSNRDWTIIQGWTEPNSNIKDYVHIGSSTNFNGRIDYIIRDNKSIEFYSLGVPVPIMTGSPLIIEYTKKTD